MLNRKMHLVIAAAAFAASPLVVKAAPVITFSYDQADLMYSADGLGDDLAPAPFNAATNTVTIPAGSFLDVAVDVLVTGNNNPAGQTTGVAGDASTYNRTAAGTKKNSQPTILGIGSFGYAIADNHKNFAAIADAGGGVSTASPGGNTNFSPFGPGNLDGNGGINSSGPISGGVLGGAGTGNLATNVKNFGDGGGAANEIFNGLQINAIAGGTAVFTPSNPIGLNYFTYINGGTTATQAPNYNTAANLTSGTNTDGTVVNNLPALTVVVTSVAQAKIISLTAAANSTGSVSSTPFGGTYNPNAPTAGKINVVGAAGSYVRGELNGIGSNVKTGSTGIRFETAANTTSDPGTEYIGLNIADTSAGTFDADIQALVNDINSANLGVGSVVAYATKNTATGDSLANAPASEQFAALGLNAGKPAGFYDVVIALPSVNSGDGFLGLDFTAGGTNPSELSTLSVTDIAAVPEPASVAGLLIGSAGLLMGRRKRKA